MVVLFLTFFGSTGVWTQGFMLARKVLYCLGLTCVLFALVILEKGSRVLPKGLVFYQARLDMILLFYASPSAGPPSALSIFIKFLLRNLLIFS
jgi:hypothetical protein